MLRQSTSSAGKSWASELHTDDDDDNDAAAADNDDDIDYDDDDNYYDDDNNCFDCRERRGDVVNYV